MGQVNWLAVIAAAVSMFVVGGLWYSPILFEKPWQKAAGLSDAASKGGNRAVIFGVAFVLTLIMAANLAFFISAPGTTLGFAVGAAIAAGLGWAALGLGLVALFERRPLAYFLINGGYLTVGFAVMGLILGLWR
jgi:membrane-associated HD superfamily phosphohydrolase